MATAQRVLWETITVLVFIALLIANWIFAGIWSDARVRRASEQNSAAVGAQAEEHQAELAGLLATCEEWGNQAAQNEAKAAFMGFSAGIQQAAEEGWGRYLNRSKTELLRQPQITFVHLVTPQGRVLISSNDEFAARGQFDQTGDWALASRTLRQRQGEEPGVLELAGPVTSGGRAVAYLWLGYDVAAAKSTTRPAALDRRSAEQAS